MAEINIAQPMRFTVDVRNGLIERPQRESLMRGDKSANRIIVELMYGSEPFDITGVEVRGKFCRPPNGDEIGLTGTAEGNVATVQLTDQCYTSGGHYEASVSLVLGGVERTVLFISGDVLKNGSGSAAGDEEGGGSGSGLPSGGTAGQVLVKVSSAEGAAIWKTLTAADVGARPDNWMPTAADVGALGKDETAANANKLNGKDADQYMLKTDTAADADKLGGVAASEYIQHADALTLEEIQASTDLAGKVPNAESLKIVDITDEISVTVTTGTYVSHSAYKFGNVVLFTIKINPENEIAPGNLVASMTISKYRPVAIPTSVIGYGTRMYYARLNAGGWFGVEPMAVNSVSTDELSFGFTYITGQS